MVNSVKHVYYVILQQITLNMIIWMCSPNRRQSVTCYALVLVMPKQWMKDRNVDWKGGRQSSNEHFKIHKMSCCRNAELKETDLRTSMASVKYEFFPAVYSSAYRTFPGRDSHKSGIHFPALPSYSRWSDIPQSPFQRSLRLTLKPNYAKDLQQSQGHGRNGSLRPFDARDRDQQRK